MAKPLSTDFITIRGKAMYARILGAPMDNFDKNGKEWKMDLVLMNAADEGRLKKLGISSRIKQKEDYLDGAPHMTVKQRTELVVDPDTGVKSWANPIKIFDITGEPWNRDTLIGNDSVVDVKLRVADYGKALQKGVYINGIRVLELVPYASKVFDEMDKDDPYYQKANTANKLRKVDVPDADDNRDDADDDDDVDDIL